MLARNGTTSPARPVPCVMIAMMSDRAGPIAAVAQTIGLGLYVLFTDDTLSLPALLKFSNLDDVESHLVSSGIAVLAVWSLREAVAGDGQRDLLGFGVALALALALVIAVITLYLVVKGKIRRFTRGKLLVGTLRGDPETVLDEARPAMVGRGQQRLDRAVRRAARSARR